MEDDDVVKAVSGTWMRKGVYHEENSEETQRSSQAIPVEDDMVEERGKAVIDPRRVRRAFIYLQYGT